MSHGGMSHVLALLTPANRLAMEIALQTGLRINDVLSMRKEDVSRRFVVIEQKTGKKRVVFLTKDLVDRARGDGAPGFVFPHARDAERHRTRQAVWRDVARAARALRVRHVSPHTARKVFAVDYYRAHGRDMERTRKVLNHDRSLTTMLYVLSDIVGDDKKRS